MNWECTRSSIKPSAILESPFWKGAVPGHNTGALPYLISPLTNPITFQGLPCPSLELQLEERLEKQGALVLLVLTQRML